MPTSQDQSVQDLIHPSLVGPDGGPLSLKPLFPTNRPDISGAANPDNDPMGQRPRIAPEVLVKMPVDHLVDMEIAGMVNSRYESSKTWRRLWRIIWDKCWEHMKAKYDSTGKQSWQQQTFQPATSKTVEIIVANLHTALFGPEVPIEWQTRRPDMDQEVRSVNELVQGDFDKCNAKVHFTDFLRTLCICGTSIGKVGYLKSEETVMVKNRAAPSPIDPMLQAIGINSNAESFVPKKMLVKDYATITHVDLYDIYPQPRVSDICKDGWIIEEGKITNRELVMGARDPDTYYRMDNVSDALLQGSDSKRTDQDPEKQIRRFALLDYQFYTHFLDPDREHSLRTFYGQIPLWYLQPELRKDESRRYDSVPGWIQVVDGQYVIRKRISPYRDGEPPYFKGNYIRLPNEFYGIGVAELILGLQIEKNEIRNCRMDNINLSMNKIIAVIKDKVAPGEWQRLRSDPGALWLLKGIDKVQDAIQPVEMGNVTQDTWQASQEVDREIQEVTAAVKATIGAGGGSDQAGGATFRGQLLNQQAAADRWMLYARVLEYVGLAPAIRKFYQRIYQFKSYQDAVETLGGDRGAKFQFISPEDLDRIAKLVPQGTMSLENKGVKLAQMTQFAQMWMPNPFFKKLEMARRMWIIMGNPEPDMVLFTDEEQQQFNQAQQQMMAMQQQMQMGGPGGGMGGPQGPPPGAPQMGGPQPPPPNGPPQPVAGNTQYPMYGVKRPAYPAQGPGANPIDMVGHPMS